MFSTIIDTDNDGADADDEVLSESWFDGAGRVRRSRTEHPGSTGGWSATRNEYDILGRIKKQSVPTEVSVPNINDPNSWTPAGDDNRGLDGSGNPVWLWTHQKYDWMGRVVRKINTDGIDQETLNDSDILISYEGCGCAGGLVTTVESELVPRDDTSGNARRKQKVYQDILGRAFKTETFNWAGNVYLRTEHNFNGRGQVIQTTQTDVAADPDVVQTTTAAFDGHGRLISSHRPEQRDTSNNLKYTTYNYNPDDSILNITDGRGVVTNYEYNSRGLVTDITWNVGSTGVADTPDVAFEYDNLGNRTSMTDGLGTVTFAYDSLSQMTSETREFNDELADAPLVNGEPAFRIIYTYEIGGQLKSYTDPYGAVINYAFQKSGHLNSLTGSSFAGITNYVSNPQYRAWGGLKHLEYGSGRQSDVTYGARLQALTHVINEISTPSNKVFDKDYEYYADGRLKLADENNGSGNDKFDRLFTYDHQGRVKQAKSGIEAHGQTETDLSKLPYRQSYTWNAFGNVTSRESTMWDFENDWNFEYSITNNRIVGYGYDNDGRQIVDPRTEVDGNEIIFEYNAAGQMVKTWRFYNAYETLMHRDGEGAETKRSHRNWIPGEGEEQGEWGEWETLYFINSSVLGQTVSETTGTGKKLYTYVVGDAGIIARQHVNDEDDEHMAWYHADESGLSSRSFATAFGSAMKDEELDALGNNLGSVKPSLPPGQRGNTRSPNEPASFADPMIGDCSFMGVFGPCSFMDEFASGVTPFSNDSGLPVLISPRDRSPRTNPIYRNAQQRLWSERSGFSPFGFDLWANGETHVWVDNGDMAFFAQLHNAVLGPVDLMERLKRANELVDKHVIFASHPGSGKFEEEENRKMVKRSLIWMLANPDCEKAFIDSKLETPASVIKRRGLTLASAGLLLNPSAAKRIGLSEDARQALMKHVNKGDNQAFTATNAGPRVYTFFKNLAFNGESYMWGYYAIEEIVVHETGMHLVGVEGIYPSIIGGHDLSGHPNYDTIMNACRIDK